MLPMEPYHFDKKFNTTLMGLSALNHFNGCMIKRGRWPHCMFYYLNNFSKVAEFSPLYLYFERSNEYFLITFRSHLDLIYYIFIIKGDVCIHNLHSYTLKQIKKARLKLFVFMYIIVYVYHHV